MENAERGNGNEAHDTDAYMRDVIVTVQYISRPRYREM